MVTKSALITGGSRGIGRAIVIALAQLGWQVTYSFRSDTASSQETLLACGEYSSNVQAVLADVGSPDDRNRLVEQAFALTGKLDLLVNNAGMAPRQRVDLLDIQETSYDEVLQTNLKGPFFLTAAVAKRMIAHLPSDQGTTPPMIINMGSISAYASSIQRGEYCISKAGMAMMTTLFADRLARDGILVYEIRPGIIATDMTAGVKEKYDALIAEGLLPIQRWGTAEDVARAVVAIAEGALVYSTGEVINIDGGFHLRRF